MNFIVYPAVVNLINDKSPLVKKTAGIKCFTIWRPTSWTHTCATMSKTVSIPTHTACLFAQVNWIPANGSLITGPVYTRSLNFVIIVPANDPSSAWKLNVFSLNNHPFSSSPSSPLWTDKVELSSLEVPRDVTSYRDISWHLAALQVKIILHGYTWWGTNDRKQWGLFNTPTFIAQIILKISWLVQGRRVCGNSGPLNIIYYPSQISLDWNIAWSLLFRTLVSLAKRTTVWLSCFALNFIRIWLLNWTLCANGILYDLSSWWISDVLVIYWHPFNTED